MENRIREIRNQVGLSPQQLADKAGTSNQQISMLERGERRLTVGWMRRLGPALGVLPSELLSTELAPKRIRLIGHVKAGEWLEPLENEDHDGEWISVPIPDIYIKLRAYALTVAVRQPAISTVLL